MKRTFMKAAVKTFTVFLAVAALAIGVGMPASAQAALPAPNFMPGFPMLAGPQIIVMWSPVAGAVKYKLFMDGNLVIETPAIQHILPEKPDHTLPHIIPAKGLMGQTVSINDPTAKFRKLSRYGALARTDTAHYAYYWNFPGIDHCRKV